MAITFDTHEPIKSLQEVGFSEAQAEAQVKVLANVLEQREDIYKQKLATKEDIEEVRRDILNLGNTLEIKMRDNTISLIKWFVPLLIAQSLAIVALLKYFEN